MKDNWSTAAFCMVFVLAFGGVGVFASWVIVGSIVDWQAAKDWVRVKADVVSWSGGEVVYRYTIDGREYRGERLNPSVIGAGGADNVDDGIDARLAAALAEKKPITVYVDPSDPKRAMVDREMPWRMTMFFIPFALGFGGVGLGALYVMVKLLTGGDEKEKESGAKVEAASSGALGIWIFAFFWNALSIPISAIAVPQMLRDGEWLGLLILIFPAIGLLMLWAAIKMTWTAIRKGSASLHVQNAPVHLGSVVAGHVTAKRMSAGDTFRVKLECSTAPGTPQALVHWTKETTARVVEGPQGARVAFSFQTPDHLPEAAGERGENTPWWVHLYRDAETSPTYSFAFELLPPQGAEHESEEEDEAAGAIDDDEPQLAGAAAAPASVAMQNLARMMGAKSIEAMNPTQRARFEARLNSMTPEQRQAIEKVGNYAGYLPLVKKLVIGIVVLFILVQVIGVAAVFLFAK